MSVNITKEMYDTFMDNGLTEDDIQYTVNYYRNKGQSDDEIFNNLNNKYKSLIKPQNVPVRPKSNFAGNFVQGLTHGLTALPTALGSSMGNNLRPLIGKEKLTPEQIKEAYSKAPIYSYTTRNPKGISGGLGNFTGELLPFLALPEVKLLQGAGTGAKIGNMALTGGYQGTIAGAGESVKNNGLNKNIVPSALTGGVTGGAIGAGAAKLFGGISKLIENPQFQGKLSKALEVLTSVPAEYSERALEKELAGQSILTGKFDPKTAYRAIEEKLTAARSKLADMYNDIKNQYKILGKDVGNKLNAQLKPENYFDENMFQLGQKATNGLNYLKNNAENKIMEVLSALDDKAVNTDNIKNTVRTMIDQFGHGGVYNSVKEEAPHIVNYLNEALNKEGLTLRDLHRIKEHLYDLGYQADNLKQGTAAQAARGVAGQINNYLRNAAPEYIKPNEVYSSIVKLEKELGGLNKNTIGAKLKDYGNSSQILSGFKEKLQKLNDTLPDEMKFLNDVQKINSERLAQKQLQESLPKSVLNDISKYEGLSLDGQYAFENFAPEQLAKYNDLLQEQNAIKDTLRAVSEKYSDNPRPLADKTSLRFENAINDLQNSSGIKFIDELNDTRAREALERLAPGQGGGSGGEQGFMNNVVRPIAASAGRISTGAILGNTLGGPVGAALGLAAVSPKIAARGTIRNLGRINNFVNSPLADNTVRPLYPLSAMGASNLLYGGISNLDDENYYNYSQSY